MKKILRMIALFACVLCMACGFAACDEKEDGKGDEGSAGQTTDVGQNDNGEQTTDGENTQSPLLTEEQWKAAFAKTSFENFKAHLTMTQGEGEGAQKQEQDVEFDGLNMYLKEGDEEEYATTINAKNYKFTYENDRWYRSETVYNQKENFVDSFFDFGDMFSDFVYSETEAGYVYSLAAGQTTTLILPGPS